MGDLTLQAFGLVKMQLVCLRNYWLWIIGLYNSASYSDANIMGYCALMYLI